MLSVLFFFIVFGVLGIIRWMNYELYLYLQEVGIPHFTKTH